MTTTSPGIITVPATTHHGWRITWARRENERRRRAHQAELEAWHRRADELARQRIEATGFLGSTRPRTGLPVDLADDELVYRVLPTAELVEAVARHVPGLPAPALSVGAPEPPGRALPKGLRVVDAGIAVVTNHRVAFGGRTLRGEWWYADLTGPAHHPDVPLTLLHTHEPGTLAGLLVPATSAANARFYLTLAVAAARGERAAVVAELDALADAHRRDRPVPPPPADPRQAPLTALRPERRGTAVTALAALAFASLTAGAYGSEQDGPRYRVEAGLTVDGEPRAGTNTVVPRLAPATFPPHLEAASGIGPAPVGASGEAARAHPSARPAGSSVPAAPSDSSQAGSGGAAPSGGARAAAPGPPTPPAPTTAPSAPAPTAAPPAPAPTTPAPSSPSPATPAPTTPPPSRDGNLLTLCLDPLSLPLLDRLLCPTTE